MSVRVRADLKPDEVGSAVMGVDVVGEGEDIFRIPVVVLQGNVNVNSFLLSFQVDRFGMDGRLVLVQILDKRNDPPFVLELLLFLGPFIDAP